MKRIISIILIFVFLLMTIALPNTSKAVENKATIYATHRYGNLLKRENIDLTCIYMVHNLNGKENPAYCLNYGLDGATESFSYDVTINSQVTDMELWRTVVNGYPYKTPQELGCETKEEAYLATRQAVYCALYQRDPNSYESFGTPESDRTLNALKQIVNIARTSKEVKQSPTVTIKTADKLWQVDNIDKNYISKTFTISANASIKDYTIELSDNELDEIKVTDINNKEKNKFKNNERFKVIMPIKNLEKDGNFTINVKTEVYTRPVYYGESNSSNLQNIAVTGMFYEEGIGTKTEYYFKNQTKIKIQKQDQDEKTPLANVKFQILDENKEVIFSDLTTNEKGNIEIENLLPGKYYVKEIETLTGYEVYEDMIEVDLKLNEEKTVTVNNLKNEEQPPKLDKTKTELEVEQVITEVEVEQPKIEEEKTNLQVEQIKEIEKEIEPEVERTKIVKEIRKLPKTGM